MKKNINKISKEEFESQIKEETKKAKKKMKSAIKDYKSFAMKGNIVDMAIGVVIGSAFTNIVNSLVSTTITPLISMLTNNIDLSTLFISLSGVKYESLEAAKAAGAATWNYGLLLNALLNFFIITVTMFIVVKYLDRIKKKTMKAEQEEKQVTTKKCKYCLSEIPVEAVKCAYCASDLKEEVK